MNRPHATTSLRSISAAFQSAAGLSLSGLVPDSVPESTVSPGTETRSHLGTISQHGAGELSSYLFFALLIGCTFFV